MRRKAKATIKSDKRVIHWGSSSSAQDIVALTDAQYKAFFTLLVAAEYGGSAEYEPTVLLGDYTLVDHPDAFSVNRKVGDTLVALELATKVDVNGQRRIDTSINGHTVLHYMPELRDSVMRKVLELRGYKLAKNTGRVGTYG